MLLLHPYINTMSKEVIDFYDKESSIYSAKRYLGEVTSYTQFFFHKRLTVVVALMKDLVKDRKQLSLLDIACADGIITQKVAKEYNENFSFFVGNDISAKMVKVANELNHDSRISFYIKNETPDYKFDIVLALGFLSGSILKYEIDFASQYLKNDSFFICTLVSKYSILSLLKVRTKPYYQDYWSYKKQEALLKEEGFQIIKVIPCGLFIPLLWKSPKMARKIQPILEVVFSFMPNLYQEKIYLLQRTK